MGVGGASARPKVLICQNFGQILKTFGHRTSIFLTILIKLLFVIEFMNKFLLCI